MQEKYYSNWVDASLFPKVFNIEQNIYCAAFPLMKLIPAKYIIDKGIKNGDITKDTTVVETSSGTFALGMAMVCNMYGLRSIIVSDPVIDLPLKRRLEDLGAKVDIVEKPESTDGYQGARLKRLYQYLENGDIFWTQQYDNYNNNLSYGPVGNYLTRTIGKVDVVVGSVGSGGSMSGLLASMRKSSPEIQGVAVDTHGSVLFGQRDRPRILRGLGNSIIPKNLKYELFDYVHWIDAQQAFYFTRKLHRNNNLFVGPTSGAAYSVANWYGRTHPGKTILVIFPDEGYRYQDTVYNDQWLQEQGMLTWKPNDTPLLVQSPTQVAEGWAWMKWDRRSNDSILAS